MKTMFRTISLLLIMVFLLNVFGCYGSFALTKKVYNLNGNVGDKFINTIVMWVFMILPVYEAAGFIDLVVLNTLEFWTGNNPLAMQDGIQAVKYATNDGKTYKIVISKNTICIAETVGPDAGKTVIVNYSPETGNWTLNNGNSEKIVANLGLNNLKLLFPNGTSREIALPQ
jgi:hypothetical protein